MAVERHILEKATEIVAHAQHRVTKIRSELEALEIRKAAIKAELQLADLVTKRISSFVIRNGTDYQCPRCWLEEESSSSLKQKRGGEWRGKFFICELCELEIKLISE